MHAHRASAGRPRFENGKHPENGWNTQKAGPLAGLLSLH
jgi:hypothetical protein